MELMLPIAVSGASGHFNAAVLRVQRPDDRRSIRWRTRDIVGLAPT